MTKVILLLTTIVLLLPGCSDYGRKEDLKAFVEGVKSKPAGAIEPVPPFESYELFSYSASDMRSPFERPRLALQKKRIENGIKPDPNRAKEYLEQFDIAAVSMVGSISNDAGLWGLIRVEGGIYRVKPGDYLGRNDGRITHIDDQEIQLLEIIPVGPQLWIERQRRIPLSEMAEK